MAELTVPKLDFSPLANLPKVYEENAKKRTLAEIGRGLADGSLDYNSAGAKLAGLGDLNSGLSLIKLGQEQKAGQEFMQSIPGLYGGGQAASSGQPQSVSSPMGNASKAISSIETGGNYRAVGPITKDGDRAYGVHQVMGKNIGPWTKEVLGREMTPQEFLASPEAQDKVFQAKFGQYTQKYGPNGAARAWFAGEGGMNDPNRRDQLGTSVADYGNRFDRAMGFAPTQVASNDPSVGVPQPQPPTQSQPLQIVAGQQPSQPQTQPQAQPQGDGLAISPRIQSLLQAVANPRLPAAQKDVAKILLQRELDASKLPDTVKKYMFARSQGYQGSLMDYETDLKKAGATAITNNMRGENAEAAAIGKAAGERAAETMKTAGAATKSLANVSRIEALLNQVSQGKLEPARMTVSAWAKSLGLNNDAAEVLGLDPKGVGSAQALQALINESVVGKIGSGGFPANNFSDADREFLVGIFPQLGNDPRANKILIETAKRVYQTDREKGRAWLAFRRNPNTRDRSFDDFEMEWADKVAKEDRFGDLRRKAQEIIGSSRAVRDTVSSPAARPPGSPQTPHSSNLPRVTSPAEVKSLGLKSGDRFLDDAGNIRQVP